MIPLGKCFPQTCGHATLLINIPVCFADDWPHFQGRKETNGRNIREWQEAAMVGCIAVARSALPLKKVKYSGLFSSREEFPVS